MTSEKCEDILKDPSIACTNPKLVKQRAFCGAWDLIEKEKISFQDALKISWNQIKEECHG